jgi:uncharacterized protein (UPF0276 family)
MLADPPAQAVGPSPIPAEPGIGLRGPHHAEFLTSRPDIAWIEVHSENYLATGGTAFEALERVRQHYPVSLHGVGLSLGSAEPVDKTHTARLKQLVDSIEPAVVSEHLSWGAIDGRHSNDLLPLPFNEEALTAVCNNIDAVQTRLGRNILIENISAYLKFGQSEMSEWEFLVEAARRSGAGVLLDINNIYVNAINHRFDAEDYLEAVPADLIEEIHLAGHSLQDFEGFEILIDTHDGPVCDEVWQLYESALKRFGPRPTLIEWDAKLPPLTNLLDEAAKAESLLEMTRDRAA